MSNDSELYIQRAVQQLEDRGTLRFEYVPPNPVGDADGSHNKEEHKQSVPKKDFDPDLILEPLGLLSESAGSELRKRNRDIVSKVLLPILSSDEEYRVIADSQGEHKRNIDRVEQYVKDKISRLEADLEYLLQRDQEAYSEGRCSEVARLLVILKGVLSRARGGNEV